MKQLFSFTILFLYLSFTAFAQGDAIPITAEEKKALYGSDAENTETNSVPTATYNTDNTTESEAIEGTETESTFTESFEATPQPRASKPSHVSGVMDYVDDTFLEDTTGYYTGGQITILGDPRIDHLIHVHTKQRGRVSKVPGYRIQIIQDTKRETIKNEKMRLIGIYGNLPVYETYNAPFFKLRIGNYTDRFEAYKLFLELKPSFKRAFIVRDMVRP